MTLAELLGVEESVLEAMLTQRVVTTRSEVFTKQLSVPDAELTRNAIVKSLYEVCTHPGARQRDTNSDIYVQHRVPAVRFAGGT